MRPTTAGWYPDPTQVGGARYHDGKRWSTRVSWGGREFHDNRPLREVEEAADAQSRADLSAYLHDAHQRGVIDDAALASMLVDIGATWPTVAPAVVAPAAPSQQVTATPSTFGIPLHTPAPRAPKHVQEPVAPGSPSQQPQRATPHAHETPAPVPPKPDVVAEWWDRVRTAVASDLAVHGLAYLGVLMLFVGVFGLIVFSFGEVDPGVRMAAEIAAPASYFVSSWFLRRREALVVSKALLIVGAAIAPIVIVASLTDGAPVPPDVHGRALSITQGVACLVVAFVFALLARRESTRPLRFAVAPIAWLAVALIAGVTRGEAVSGSAVARPVPMQMAAVVVAIAATALMVVVVRARNGSSALIDATASMLLPFGAVAFAIELLFSATDGWQTASGLTATIGAFALVDITAPRMRAGVVPIVQTVLVLAGMARALPEIRPSYVGLSAVLVFVTVVERTGRDRPSREGFVALLVGTVVALIPTAIDPWPTLLASGVLMAWLLWRRSAPPAWMTWRDPYGALPAAWATVALAQLWRLADPGVASLVVAAVVCGVAVVTAVVPALRTDPLREWWVPGAAVVVAISTLLVQSHTPFDDTARLQVVIAALLATITLGLAAKNLAGRVWLMGAATAWALANAAWLLELDRSTQALIAASIGFVSVVAGTFIANRVVAHVAMMGHVVGAASVAIAGERNLAFVLALGGATVGWLVVAVTHELRGARHLERVVTFGTTEFDPAWRRLDSLPAFATAIGLLLTVPFATDVAGRGDPTVALSGAITAMVLVAATHWLPLTKAPVKGIELLALAAVAVGVVMTWVSTIGERLDIAHSWTLHAAFACGIGTASLIRHSVGTRNLGAWFGWGLSLNFVASLAQHAGLPARWFLLANGVWGAVMVLGALTVARRRAADHSVADDPHSVTGSHFVLAPASLGLAAVIAAGTVESIVKPPMDAAWITLGAGALAFAIAVLTTWPAVTLVGYALVTVAGLTLLPFHPIEHPWMLVIWSAALAALGWGMRSLLARRDDAVRWARAPFLIAHAVALAAVLASGVHGSQALTFALVGLLGFAVAVVLRSPWWAIGAAVAELLAAYSLNLGWLALALAVEGLAVTIIGLRRDDRLRLVLLIVGCAMAWVGWVTFTSWRWWDVSAIVLWTALIAGTISLVVASCARIPRTPLDLAIVWLASSAFTELLCLITAVQPTVDHRPAGVAVAIGLELMAIAAAVLVPLWGNWLRWTAVGLTFMSGSTLAWALDATAGWSCGVGTTIGLVLSITLLLTHAVRPQSRWILPGAFLAIAAQVAAFAAAVSVWPDHGLVLLTLLALAGEAAVLGTFVQQPPVIVASPIAACAAWLVFASDALGDEVNWFTVPIGLAILVVEGLIRWIRRARGGDATATEIVMLDHLGMFAMVCASVVQTLIGNLWYSLLAIGVAIGITIWGTSTRVRRRLMFGVCTIVLTLAILLIVPLAQVVPTLEGPALWLTITALGVVAIAIATTLEQGRRKVRALRQRLDEMMTGWE